MPRQRPTYRRLADDPEFRAMLGPDFAVWDADQIDTLLTIMLDIVREAVEEWAATVPHDPHLRIKV